MDQLLIFGAVSYATLEAYKKMLMNKNAMLIENNSISEGGPRIPPTPDTTSIRPSYLGRVNIESEDVYNCLKKQGYIDNYKRMDDYYRTIQMPAQLDSQHLSFRKQFPLTSEL